jgi:hypothetical protein
MTIGLQYTKHAQSFKEGTRILGLISHQKDGNIDQTKHIFRVSHCPEHFDKIIKDFEKISAPLDRIYISAAPRSVSKAAKMFQSRQLDAAYDLHPMAFYKNLETRWIFCLMNPQCTEYAVWFFDCDSVGEYAYVKYELIALDEIVSEIATYPTKNGFHIIVKPFHRSKLSKEAHEKLKTDALLLWSVKTDSQQYRDNIARIHDPFFCAHADLFHDT